jgi:hypothetical protein
MASVSPGGALRKAGFGIARKFFEIEGIDIYYGQGKNVLRHRFDGQEGLNCLTVKKRKSKKSLRDRHEVDLKMENGPVSCADITAFLKLSGWKEMFRLRKKYWIVDIKNSSGAIVCLALYDVSSKGRKTKRFLEAEVERHSTIGPRGGLRELKKLEGMLRDIFKLDKPVNESLFEMYR